MKKISLKLLLLAALIAVGIAEANAESVKIGDLYYTLWSFGGAHVAQSDEYVELTDVIIPDSVTYNDKTYSVTSIGSSAFKSCSGLTSVTIPNSVTNIGDNAFENCSGLTSVTIGNSVTRIGYSAFENCSGLEKVIISDLTFWCNISFGDLYSNPLIYANHLYIGDVEVTDLKIPDGVRSIKNYVFEKCSGLKSVTIPNSVTTIGDNTFSGCSGLTSVKIGNSVTKIGESAFSDCSGLTSVTIPNSVTVISYEAFENCNGLEKVIISDLTSWCNISFSVSKFKICSSNPLYYAKHLYIEEKEVTDLIIPDGISSTRWLN